MEWSQRIEETDGDAAGYVKKSEREVSVGVVRGQRHFCNVSMAITFPYEYMSKRAFSAFSVIEISYKVHV